LEQTPQPRVIAATVTELPHSAAERFANDPAARYKRGDEWHQLDYAEIGEAIEEVALGLIDLGIDVGDRVCILADTRLEWTLASYGITVAGGIVVPIYPTNSPHECKWVIGNSEARGVICENATQRAKILQIRDELPSLQHLVTIEPEDGEPAQGISLRAIRERGRDGDRSELAARREAVGPDDPYTIIYTSGTTGPPKGVVLTHANAMSVCQMVEELAFVAPGETTYLYLPLAHAFALTSQLASVDQGTSIVYYGGNTKKIVEEIARTRPTYLPSVPRIFEKIYNLAVNMQAKASDEDQQRFKQAIKLGVEVRLRQSRGDDVPA
jgi:long-chain acyl-CoA synthetase